jgi:SAM-dependent methyltransferase
LPSFGEAERIDALVPPGAAILELGSGVGRVTNELVRLGHPVTAVDESDEMLAHVEGAETVQSKIEDLDLGRCFACVLLMSNLVNVPVDAQRTAFLRTCARHLASHGIVLIERHETDWRPETGSRSEHGGVSTTLENARVEPPLVAATVRYEADGRVWYHPFVARLLDDAELDAELHRVGLRRTNVFGEKRTWVEARPYSTHSSCVTSPAV